MKAGILLKLSDAARAHKKLSILVICLLAAALGACAWFGWGEYQRRQTSAFALEKIKEALNPPDPAQLSRLVDVGALSSNLARALQQSFPFYLAGPDQERDIRHALQTGLLKRLLAKPQKPENLEGKKEEEILKLPLQVLPPDFIEQLLANLNVRDTGPGEALLTAQIKNPLLKHDFTLALNMRKGSDGWKVERLANAGELVSQLRADLLERHARLREVYREKNAGTTKLMNQILPIQSCSANAGLLSDGKTMLMIIHVIARNKGSFQVNNFNLDASVSGRGGQTLVRRYLNTAKPVSPGEDFSHRWSMEMDAQSPLAQSLLHGAPLRCTAAWQTLGLGNGKVLHIVETPNPDRDCQIPNHKHPEGFCLTPIFQR